MAAQQPAKLSGGCLCGAICYETTPGTEPIYNVICHCVSCKKATGTQMIHNSILKKSQFTLLSGTPRNFHDTTTDTPILRSFCGDCGSPVFTTTDAVPDIVAITSGTMDQGMTWWRPNKEQCIEAKSHWLPELPIIPKEGVVQRHQRGPMETQKF